MSTESRDTTAELREEILEAIKEREVPIAVTTHIADYLDESAPRVRNMMKVLVNEGELHSMKAGTTNVYWIPNDDDEESSTGHEGGVGPCAECDASIDDGEPVMSILITVTRDGEVVTEEDVAHRKVYHRYCYKEKVSR